MKFENTEVFNFEGAIRGMRNPKESWKLSDSKWELQDIRHANKAIKCCGYEYIIGQKDLELMQTLIKAGSEHRKFMRQIFVSVDITAPLYWWKEFDTYKVGTAANSTSTMHKLASTPITMDCFEMDDYVNVKLSGGENNYVTESPLAVVWKMLIDDLERLRQLYNETKDKRYWKELIRLLPESWLQTRTVTMNYENLLSMYHHRKTHKLSEWSNAFIQWIKSLPYAQELLLEEKK